MSVAASRDRSLPRAYREHAPTGPWAAEVACVWTSVSHPRSSAPVVPDGCTDLLWSSSRGAVVVGPMTRPVTAAFPPGTEHVALRLRPGRTERVLGVPASALTDLSVPVADVLGAAGRDLDQRLGDAAGSAARRALLEDLPGLAPAAELDGPVLAALAWLVARPTRHVAEAAAHVGWSERQLRRRVTAAVGYGPKRFQRVVRVQRFLAAGPSQLGDLARLAADLGYADQAHLSREVRELTGRAATAALRGSRPTLVSGTSKHDDLAVAQAAVPGGGPPAGAPTSTRRTLP